MFSLRAWGPTRQHLFFLSDTQDKRRLVLCGPRRVFAEEAESPAGENVNWAEGVGVDRNLHVMGCGRPLGVTPASARPSAPSLFVPGALDEC